MQRILVIVLALGLALSPASFAAEPAPDADAPMAREGRVVLETLGGYGGAAVGGLVGYGLGLAIGGDEGDLSGLLGAVGGIPGAAIGLPTGIYFIGELCGGDGNYWLTWVGVLAGAVVPLIATYATPGDDGGAVLTLLWATLPVAGGGLGYELSQSERGEPTSAGLRLEAGLSGRF